MLYQPVTKTERSIKWVSVDEKLPEFAAVDEMGKERLSAMVLIFDNSKNGRSCHNLGVGHYNYTNEKWEINYCRQISEITHWADINLPESSE